MAPIRNAVGLWTDSRKVVRSDQTARTRASVPLENNIVEAWSEGFMVGAIVILIMITLANMRSGVLLHKLILLELIMALWHGTFIFFADPVYGWYLSSTAIFLYLSYNLHNVITWIKNKPFLPRWGSLLYIGTIILACPYWIAEMVLNFEYNNDLGNSHFQQTRPWEALARDPWWIFTSCSLIYIIKREYDMGVFELIRASPRFGILMTTISLSLIFIVADVVETATHASKNDGINPYWKLALVFKCGSDALFLDDFKKVLDQLTAHALGRLDDTTAGVAGSLSDANISLRAESHRIRDYGIAPIHTRGSNTSEVRASVSNVRRQRTQSSNGSHISSKRKRRRRTLSFLKFGRGSGESGQQPDDLQSPELAQVNPGRKPPLEWFDVMAEREAGQLGGTSLTNISQRGSRTSKVREGCHIEDQGGMGFLTSAI